MTVHDGEDLALHQVKRFARVGDGGQGEVFEAGGPGRLLYKEYREPHKVRGDALTHLVRVRQEMAPAERDRLDRQAAWPLCRVTDGGRVTGFLMHRAPEAMTWTTSKGDGKLIELSYLLREAKAAWSAVPQPVPAQRLDLVVQVVSLLEWLHGLGLVVGDLSHANVLWSLAPEPAVHLLDCDGIRAGGQDPVLDQADTPDWHDPLAPAGLPASVDSDRYKAALMIGRILCRDPLIRPGEPLTLVPGTLDDRRAGQLAPLWRQAAGPAGSARTWAAGAPPSAAGAPSPCAGASPAPPRPVPTRPSSSNAAPAAPSRSAATEAPATTPARPSRTRGAGRSASQGQLATTPSTNADRASAENSRAGPWGCLLSRTATVVGETMPHSTHWAPLSEREDLHQVTGRVEASLT